MSVKLPPAVRQYLDAIDGQVETLDPEARAELARHALLTLNQYQGLPEVALARLIMESVVAMDGALARSKRDGGDLEKEIREVMFSAAALSSALTRKARGRRPLWT